MTTFEMTNESAILWIVAILFLWIGAVFFVHKARKAQIAFQKNMDLGIALFFALYSITRLLFIIGWYVTRDESSDLYDLYWRIATIIGLGGFTFLVFVLERYPLNKRTKYLGTILACIAIILSLVIGKSADIVLEDQPSHFSALIIALYIYIPAITQGALRRKALLNFFGILVILFGVIFDTNIAYSIFALISSDVGFVVQSIMGPGLFIVGVLIFTVSNR